MQQQPQRRPVAIIDETIKLLRRTWGVQILFALIVFGINALMVAPFTGSILSILMNEMVNTMYGGYSDPMALVAVFAGIWVQMGLTLLASILTSIVSYGFILACRNAMQGRSLAFGEIFREMLHKTGRILLQGLLYAAIYAGLYIAMLLVAFVMVALANVIGLLAVGLMVVLYIALCVFAVIWAIRISLTSVINVFEDTWYVAAWTRGWRITRGSAGRIFGYTLLLSVIFGMVSGLVGTIFGLGGNVVMITMGSVIGYLISAVLSIAMACLHTVLYHASLERAEGTPYPQWE